MRIPVTEFIPPHGRQASTEIDIPDRLADVVQHLSDLDMRLTVEQLSTGKASLTLEQPRLGDFLIEILPASKATREDCTAKFIEMLESVDIDEVRKWHKVMTRIEEGGEE